ncbi:hypothetical protein CEXT_117821 [Caerostris extrusa]|uniref:Uncharacterized protein n=1 Tax=Caerostris extrusa TaxID=172846 RepID=A0AAV4UY59_CAEEX|nr:hypothetical protein CEXT_117821 [Caerostris extrusa]
MNWEACKQGSINNDIMRKKKGGGLSVGGPMSPPGCEQCDSRSSAKYVRKWGDHQEFTELCTFPPVFIFWTMSHIEVPVLTLCSISLRTLCVNLFMSP